MWLCLLFLAAAPTEVRYLALGDSFTIGTGSSEKEAFPSRLKPLLEKKKAATVKLLNPAVNGYSTQELIDDELPTIDTFKPTFVTLAIGANDIVRGREPDDFRKNLKVIFAALPKNATVLVIPQPDWSHSPVAQHFGDPDELQKQIVLYNRILEEEATAAKARYLDLWPLMRKQADLKKLAPDGLHPSPAAHAEWAEAIAKAL